MKKYNMSEYVELLNMSELMKPWGWWSETDCTFQSPQAREELMLFQSAPT